jgi:hypothetical protein
MAVMTLEHLVLRGSRVLGARAELKRIGATPVMERTSATPSLRRRQSHRFIQANYPPAECDPRDRHVAVRAGRPGSVSVVPVSGSLASMLRLAGRWSCGHATAKPAASACPVWRGRPDVMQAPIARHHAGLTGSTALYGAFTVSLRGKGDR